MKRVASLLLIAAAASLAGEVKGTLLPDRVPTGEAKPAKHFTNSLGMKFVWIPPGGFLMGGPKNEPGHLDHETQRQVTLTKGFYLGTHTVTQEQWQMVMGNNPSSCKGEKNLPVDSVSWDDCQAYVRRLRELDKKPYRLPSEAEWEYSCRAGSTTPFHYGATISIDQANYNGNHAYVGGLKGIYRAQTTPVGSFPPNAFGLYDMHGNLWQWCQDFGGAYPPQDTIDPQGPAASIYRILRGGSYLDSPHSCRSAYRTWMEPANPSYNCGVRVAFFAE